MVPYTPMNTASRLLAWSNFVYIAGSVLALSSAILVVYEQRPQPKGKPLRSNSVGKVAMIVAALASLIGAFSAIHFSNAVSHLKDVELARYRAQAEVTIAQEQKDAEFAKAIAASASGSAAIANRIAAEATSDLGPRSLTAEQQAGIAAKLSALRGRIDFFYENDPDVLPLAQEIANSLAGWQMHSFQPADVGALHGITIEFDPRDSQAKHNADALAAALLACALQVTGPTGDLPAPAGQPPAYTGSSGAKPESPLRITVGHK